MQNQIINDQTWALIKDASSCIWERVSRYGCGTNILSRGFLLDYNPKNFSSSKRKEDIVVEVFFKNKDNNCGLTKKISDRETFIAIYLPNVFGYKGESTSLSREDCNSIVSNRKEDCILSLIKTVGHELTHAFDDLFHNEYYSHYHMEMCKKVDGPSYRFSSLLEKRAYYAELECHIRHLRNRKVPQQIVDKMFGALNYNMSEFEKFIKDKPRMFEDYKKKISTTINHIYSDDRFISI